MLVDVLRPLLLVVATTARTVAPLPHFLQSSQRRSTLTLCDRKDEGASWLLLVVLGIGAALAWTHRSRLAANGSGALGALLAGALAGSGGRHQRLPTSDDADAGEGVATAEE